jgi:hypothetical protein
MLKISPNEVNRFVHALRMSKSFLKRKEPKTRGLICKCLDYASSKPHSASHYACIQLKKRIQELLGGKLVSYENWVIVHHPHVVMTPDDFIEGRIQWIDWMIEQLKTKQEF